jgi:hypothetical protein
MAGMQDKEAEFMLVESIVNRVFLAILLLVNQNSRGQILRGSLRYRYWGLGGELHLWKTSSRSQNSAPIL